MTEYHDTTKPILRATLFAIGDQVEVSALIRGDGVDLVIKSPHRTRPISVQLTVDEARATAQALVAAANESASDA